MDTKGFVQGFLAGAAPRESDPDPAVLAGCARAWCESYRRAVDRAAAWPGNTGYRPSLQSRFVYLSQFFKETRKEPSRHDPVTAGPQSGSEKGKMCKGVSHL